MVTVKAIVKKEKDGRYSVRLDNPKCKVNYDLWSEGDTIEEAKKNWFDFYSRLKESYLEEKIDLIEADFLFHLCFDSFFDYYIRKFGTEKLLEITEIPEKWLKLYRDKKVIHASFIAQFFDKLKEKGYEKGLN